MRFVLLAFVVLASGCEGGKGGGLPGPDGGANGSCGGLSGRQCAADEFCDFGRNSCGFADETGTCKPRPLSCDDNLEPACGCDSQIYSNECEAAASGVDANAVGTCQAPASQFTCGFKFCELATEFCQRFGTDIGGEPDGFSCGVLPSCTGTASCACLQEAGVACAENCSGDAASGLTTVCLGG